MLMKMKLCIVLFVVTLSSVVRAQYGDQSPVKIIHQLNAQGTSTHVWSLVHLPNNYNTTTTRYPLLVYLHGKTDNSPGLVSSDLYKISNRQGPCREIANGKSMEFTVNGVLHKYIVVCPQISGIDWNGNGFQFNSFLNEFIIQYPKVDLNRIYVTGLSQGGFNTVVNTVAQVSYAQRYAGIALVSSVADPAWWDKVCVAAANGVAVRTYCGMSDPWDSWNKKFANDYNACPTKYYEALYNQRPGDHNTDVWHPVYATDNTYYTPNLYQWFLQFNRTTLPPVVTPGPTTKPTPKPTSSPTSTPTLTPTLTPTSSPTCGAPASGSGTGLRGIYYQSCRHSRLNGVNIILNDYKSLPVPADDADLCENMCCGDDNCKAWTYGVTNVPWGECKTGDPCCFMKNKANGPQEFLSICTSGIKLASPFNTSATTGCILDTSAVNFNFVTTRPSFNPAFGFSVKWVGTLKAKYSGVHTFYASATDGLKLQINGQDVINYYQNGVFAATSAIYPPELTAGQSYTITVFYKEVTEASTVSLSWSSACLPKEIIPASHLTPGSC